MARLSSAKPGFLSFRPSLRLRLTLSVMVIALLSTLGVAAAAFFYIQNIALEAITGEQMQRTQAIAEAIDQKFISRRVVLKTLAESLETQQLRGTDKLQPVLLRQTALVEVFDNVAVFDRAGDLVANYLGLEALGKINVADREYFIETLAGNQGVISQPVRNRARGVAQVLMTQPVFDAAGKLVYVINGQITLEKPNFLGELAGLKFGKTGYVFITNTNGIVIDSPRKSRILKHFDAEGGYNEATTRAVAGFEGTTAAVNRLGVHALYAFKRTRQTNWIIGSHYPYDEAVADLRRAERWTLAAALALSLVVGGLSLLLLRWQLTPLERLHQHILATHASSGYAPLQTEYAPDELGDLARAFDRLMADRQAAGLQLEASETYLREVLEHASDAFVALDGEARITEWNRQATAIFGHKRGQALGRPLTDLLGPEGLHPEWTAGLADLLRSGGGALVGTRTEINALHRDGRLVPVELSIAAMDMGDHFIAHAFMRDITERRATQERIATSYKLLQDIADNTPSLVARLDSALRYTFVNAQLQKAYPRTKFIGQSMQEVYDADEFAIVEPWVRQALEGKRVTFEKQAPPDSSYAGIRFELTYIPDRDAQGQVQGFYSMSFDITERKRIERLIADNEAKLRGITDNLPALVAHLDAEERFTFVNSAVREWWGKEPQGLIGRTMQEVVGATFYAKVENILQRALAGERVEIETQSTYQGALSDAHSIFVPEFDADGAVIGVFVMTINITELKTAQRKLSLQARIDPLTELPNRLALNESLPIMLARSRRSGDALALMYLDIDHFKAINDTLGHAAGDEVLCEFSRRMQASVRTTDLVARLAGDEFVVVLENLAEPEVAGAVAEKIVAQVARPMFRVHGRTLSITTSIGIVFHAATAPASTPAELLARADAALYAAKSAGRNRFEFAA